ncbi:hypothetical protein KAR91_38165 [Candidatus Pacearchaeota archaeon]|nr:hypothetical protein [Candidatus Pacearchaeota archaeon]
MTNNNTKNKLADLNDHLFLQMERLNDDDLEGDKLKEEIIKAKAVTGVANQIINNARVCLDGMKAFNEGLIKTAPRMLGFETKDEID